MELKSLLSVFCLSILISCQAQVSHTEIKNGNKTPDTLEESIKDNEKIIESYYRNLMVIKNIPTDIDQKIINLLKDDSIFQEHKNYYENEIQNIKLNDTGKDSIEIKDYMKNRDQWIRESEKVRVEYNDLLALKEKIEAMEILEKQYLGAISDLKKATSNIKGEGTFNYNDEEYSYFIADLKEHIISIQIKTKAGKFHYSSIEDIIENNNDSFLMITNGGMFHSNGRPVGLLIIDSIEINKIDLSGPDNLNFNMLPNGIFYIDKGQAIIDESKSFDTLYSQKKITPVFATQSGPMLVYNGKHHPKFHHGSSSKKLRSGVGILPNGNVIFIISKEHNTNFFQFATIFKDVWGCKNALFLDGEISKMYLKKSMDGVTGGDFGPMITVKKN